MEVLINIAMPDENGYLIPDFLNWIMADNIKTALINGDMEVTGDKIYVKGIINEIGESLRWSAVYEITSNHVISVADKNDIYHKEIISYQISASIRLNPETGAMSSTNVVIEVGKNIVDDEVDLKYNRLPPIEYGFGFEDGKIHKFMRPRLFVLPIDGKVMLPHETEMVLTMNLVGAYKEATLIRVLAIGSEGTVVSTEFNRITMAEEPYIHDPDSQFSTDTIMRYVTKDEIYEFIKGVSMQLIRHFYDISDTVSDSFIYRHYRINSNDIVNFEKSVARTADSYWRLLEK